MKPNSYDDRLLLLRRELSLVHGRRAKPTRIPAAHIPWWKQLFQSPETKEIIKSAGCIENFLNESIQKPKTEEDKALLKKGRSPEEITQEINAIPIISAKWLPHDSLRLDEVLLHQIWFCPMDRYLGREAPCFVLSRASFSADTFHNGLDHDIPFSGPNPKQADELVVHNDERDRSSVSNVGDRTRLTLSKATHALLKNDVRFCPDPRSGNYNVFLGRQKRLTEIIETLSLSLHCVRKVDRQSQHFKVVEYRLPDVGTVTPSSR
jgi:hypothetical protein